MEATHFKIKLKRKPVLKSGDDFREFLERSYWPGQEIHLTKRGRLREKGIIDLHLGPFFNGSMKRINREVIIEYMLKRIAEKAARETIRKELTILKHILRIAIKLGFLARNPFEDLETRDYPVPGEKRTRHLVGDEWPRLIQQIPIEKRPAVILLVNTGMRRGELMNLTWPEVDLLNGTAWLPRTKGGIKSGKGRLVQLTPEMVTLLSSITRHETDPRVIWQFTADALSTAFRLAVRKAKIYNFHLHDLRHTFATEIRKEGAGIDLIAKLLGHADVRQSQIYAHISDDLLVDAVRSMKGKFTH